MYLHRQKRDPKFSKIVQKSLGAGYCKMGKILSCEIYGFCLLLYYALKSNPNSKACLIENWPNNSWVSLEPFSVILSGGQAKMY